MLFRPGETMSHEQCVDASTINGRRACGHSVMLCSACKKPVFGSENDCDTCLDRDHEELMLYIEMRDRARR